MPSSLKDMTVRCLGSRGRVAASLLIVVACALTSARAATVSTLYRRGYTVIPEPQEVDLSGPDFRFGNAWRLELAPGVTANDSAVSSLVEDLDSRFHVKLTRTGASPAAGGASSGVIRLEVRPNAVTVGPARDADKRALAAQAYTISLASDRIGIVANSPAGLFYGVQTLLQLVKPRDGALWLPAGSIADWPDTELREIYWDDAHHLDRLPELERAVRQAAFFKINGFSIKLEGHFQYQHAPALVDPYALSPAELQELTDYGLRYHVQVVPYLDAPAHIAFILKHPEYASLREYPDSNYELCVTNADSYKLLDGMYQDLLDANRGVKYFILSTDEPYYIGLADNDQCHEAARAKELGSVGKLLAEFLDKAAGYLHDRGRTVIFWGEYPLKPDDIASLPSYLVNGETYGPKFDPQFWRRGIREMDYTSTEGEERLFPKYYILPSADRVHPSPGGGDGRVADMFDHTSYGDAAQLPDLMGVFVAGWADAGLHPETFWLGYATGAAAGWHSGSPDPSESMNTFYPLFYGPGAVNMGRVYQLMSEQAQFWEDSWETGPSSARKPIWGNSYGLFTPPRPAHDFTLTLPAVPVMPGLELAADWSAKNAKRLELASRFLAGNDELEDLLRMNLERVVWNRYNLEVYLSIAELCRQNLRMIEDLGRIDALLKSAHAQAAKNQPARSVAALDRAIDQARRIRSERNQALRQAEETWGESWYPRVAEANGRRFLHELDDVKDHVPDRTVDMSYLVYRELILPVGDWTDKVEAVRNQYAVGNHLAARNEKLDWSDTKTLRVADTPAEDDDE